MSFQELLSSHTVFKQNFMRRLYVPVYARLLQKLSLNQIKLMTKKRIISFHIHFTLHQWIFTVWRTTQKSWLLTVGGRGERGTAIARVWRWAMKMVVASDTKHMIITNRKYIPVHLTTPVHLYAPVSQKVNS